MNWSTRLYTYYVPIVFRLSLLPSSPVSVLPSLSPLCLIIVTVGCSLWPYMQYWKFTANGSSPSSVCGGNILDSLSIHIITELLQAAVLKAGDIVAGKTAKFPVTKGLTTRSLKWIQSIFFG